jgi:hypothetical protein
MLTPEERLSRIRSIIRKVESEMDSPECDQLPLLRSAFVEIIQVVGPQKSGARKVAYERRDDEA